MITRVEVNDGKYEVVIDETTGKMHANRYGEYWQSLTGNNLIFWLAVELENARDEIANLKGVNSTMEAFKKTSIKHIFEFMRDGNSYFKWKDETNNFDHIEHKTLGEANDALNKYVTWLG
jgi:hypothetical protein